MVRYAVKSHVVILTVNILIAKVNIKFLKSSVRLFDNKSYVPIKKKAHKERPTFSFYRKTFHIVLVLQMSFPKLE